MCQEIQDLEKDGKTMHLTNGQWQAAPNIFVFIRNDILQHVSQRVFAPQDLISSELSESCDKNLDLAALDTCSKIAAWILIDFVQNRRHFHKCNEHEKGWAFVKSSAKGPQNILQRKGRHGILMECIYTVCQGKKRCAKFQNADYFFNNARHDCQVTNEVSKYATLTSHWLCEALKPWPSKYDSKHSMWSSSVYDHSPPLGWPATQWSWAKRAFQSR